MDGTAAARIEELIEHLEVSLAALRSESRNDTLTLIDRIESVTGKLNGTRLALIHQATLTSAAGDELDHRLHNSNRATIRQVRGDIRLARELESRYPLLLEALRDGQLSEQQARAIMTGLNPLQLTETQSVHCQTELIGYATQFDPSELLALATRMTEVIDPDHAPRPSHTPTPGSAQARQRREPTPWPGSAPSPRTAANSPHTAETDPT
ncbi:DUF222 domain-containing protein [Tessaracoccus defluvii]|uniref:DUF222 domain-containing protein n=1 Tax=Tessaracoccus defluvii TaxID=1285901 RepID=A0A7H0H919_9ACTN|nr:DUF222 domain-containing protein [Tessaracoccus defluvii]QNP57035.1 DUF222 domain-containing protein [Tessaracoccus defluvii]